MKLDHFLPLYWADSPNNRDLRWLPTTERAPLKCRTSSCFFTGGCDITTCVISRRRWTDSCQSYAARWLGSACGSDACCSVHEIFTSCASARSTISHISRVGEQSSDVDMPWRRFRLFGLCYMWSSDIKPKCDVVISRESIKQPCRDWTLDCLFILMPYKYLWYTYILKAATCRRWTRTRICLISWNKCYSYLLELLLSKDFLRQNQYDDRKEERKTKSEETER